MAGAALPIIGVDFAGSTESKVTAFVVLTVVAVMDVGLARYVTLPSLRRRGVDRVNGETAGFSHIDSIGIVAILAGVATDLPEAPLVVGGIGVYGWTVVRRYLEGWPEGTSAHA
ncbi:MAG: hypothetical protein WED85_11760 [Dehalococcoidia bacterium]